MKQDGIKIYKEDFYTGEHQGKLLGVETNGAKESIVYLEEERAGGYPQIKASIYIQTSDEPIHIHPLTLVMDEDGNISKNVGVTDEHVKAEIERTKDAIAELNNYINELYRVI